MPGTVMVPVGGWRRQLGAPGDAQFSALLRHSRYAVLHVLHVPHAGLATYGAKIMRVLGVKMTRLTNSRGKCGADAVQQAASMPHQCPLPGSAIAWLPSSPLSPAAGRCLLEIMLEQLACLDSCLLLYY